MNAKDQMAAGRLLAVKRFPYFRSAILGMIPKEKPGLGTFATTARGVMFWDPAVAEQWTIEQIGAVIVHEAGHLLRKHAERCEKYGADPKTYNIAGDAEINDDLVAAHLPLPGDPVLPATVGKENGLTAEEYYRAAEEALKDKKSKLSKLVGNDGESEGAGGPGNAPGESAGAAGKGADGKKTRGVGAGRCGGCAGQPASWEKEASGASGRSDVELERIRRTVAEAIQNEAAKGRGTVPGGWAKWADGVLQPAKIPWRQKLAKLVRGCIAYRPGAVDLHWSKPSRRQAGIGFGPGRPILPGLRAPVPRVSVIVDTSGSMGQEDTAAALSETQGVIAATGSTIDLCTCDAEVQGLRKVKNIKEAIALMNGGGGTDMTPAIAALMEKKPRPDLVVIMTDGLIGDPGPKPSFKVIWVVLGEDRNEHPAEWGDIVVVDDDGAHPVDHDDDGDDDMDEAA